jgi:hypothetical protein
VIDPAILKPPTFRVGEMITSPPSITAWKLCALMCLAMILLSLLPQIHLWLVRGRDWNGAYVSPQGDEPLYSAYINALIDGRSRKNDPFGGRDSLASAPLQESLFSIQFVPAYAIAVAARLSRVSASTAFIILTAAAALLASLSVFLIIKSVTADHRLAAAGTLFVLCLGGMAGGNGLIGVLLKSDLSIPSLPFLRRYQPAAVFPFFFFFQLLVWHELTSKTRRRMQASTVVAGLCLTMLVFSYFYLWTAAAAWLVCIGVLWLFFRTCDWRKVIAVLTMIAAITGLAWVPYAYMVSNTASLLGRQQILISSRGPDLLRVDEILGAFILIALFIGIIRERMERSDPRVIFVISLALLPFVVFNQQILTGKTMQAYHFEAFVINYTTLVAVVMTISLFKNTLDNRLLVFVAVLSFSWGIVEVGLPSRLSYVPSAILKDQGIPVLLRLRELSRQDGTLDDLRKMGKASTLVFSQDVALMILLPTWTSQGTLLDVSGVYYGSITREEQKQFYYMHLYYSRTDAQTLHKALSEGAQYPTAEIFGQHRLFPALSNQFQPIQSAEIEREVRNYERYSDSFSREEAIKRPIAYAIVPVQASFDFTNLDRWYERDLGERIGIYTLYRLKPRE